MSGSTACHLMVGLSLTDSNVWFMYTIYFTTKQIRNIRDKNIILKSFIELTVNLTVHWACQCLTGPLRFPPTFVVRAYPWFCGRRGLARTLAATIHDLRVPEINCSYQLFNVIQINASASSDLSVHHGLCLPHVSHVAHLPSSRGNTVPRRELPRQTY